MLVKPIKTTKVVPGKGDLLSFLDEHLPEPPERSIVVVTSKIVSIFEDRVVSAKTNKEALVEAEAEYYIPARLNRYGYSVTITSNQLAISAGIDESNSNGGYILWPQDVQRSANQIRGYLTHKYKLRQLGVIISDSICQPLQLGTIGTAIAHSGIRALHDYVGQPDLFGRRMVVTQANLANGLAAAAVVTMGECSESTPLCLIENLDFVEFQNRNPTRQELSEIAISIDDDIFAPILKSAPWQKGSKK